MTDLKVGDTVRILRDISPDRRTRGSLAIVTGAQPLYGFRCFVQILGESKGIGIWEGDFERLGFSEYKASDFTIGQRVIVEGFDEALPNGTKFNGTIGIVVDLENDGRVRIRTKDDNCLIFPAKYLRPAPEAVPKSLKKRVKYFLVESRISDSPKARLENCFTGALKSYDNDPPEFAADTIVRMIAYLTLLYKFYAGDQK